MSRHWILSFCGLVVVLSLVIGGLSGEPPTAPATSSSAAPGQGQSSRQSAAPTQFPADPLGLGFTPQLGQVDPATNGLVPTELDRASGFASWLTEWSDTDFAGRTNDHAKDMRKLAKEYRATGLANKMTSQSIDRAAELLEKGQKASSKGQYETARRHYRSAAKEMKGAASGLQSDVAKAERTTGARLTPDPNGNYTGFDYLFTVETASSSATVVRWIDGDTVDTSVGRVRLIGIDTPEMNVDCDQARAAKAYAEHVAPPGSTIGLGNPKSVINKDKYGRLLRYVDVRESGTAAADPRVDVRASLLLSSLAVARYDSRDGYQWHPRERTYRAASGEVVGSEGCSAPTEKAVFVVAAALAADKGSPEYWRTRMLSRSLKAPAAAAAETLPKHVKKTQQIRTAKEERRRAAQLERQREAQRERDEEAERQRAAERESAAEEESSDEDTGASGGGSGYNGPRCYAPGGKTWKPC